jgi:hypothetical protein
VPVKDAADPTGLSNRGGNFNYRPDAPTADIEACLTPDKVIICYLLHNCTMRSNAAQNQCYCVHEHCMAHYRTSLTCCITLSVYTVAYALLLYCTSSHYATACRPTHHSMTHYCTTIYHSIHLQRTTALL